MLQKLQNRGGCNTSHPAVIDIRIFQQTRQSKWNRRPHPISNASPPHNHLPVPCKHVRIVFRNFTEMLHKLPGIIRIIFFSELFRPQRTIHLKSPHTIIIKQRIIVIPPVTTISSQQYLQQFFQISLVRMIPLAQKKAHNIDIKKTPVTLIRAAFTITQHTHSQTIFHLLRQGIPEYLRSHHKRQS